MPIRFEYAPVEPLDSDFRRNDEVMRSTPWTSRGRVMQSTRTGDYWQQIQSFPILQKSCPS